MEMYQTRSSEGLFREEERTESERRREGWDDGRQRLAIITECAFVFSPAGYTLLIRTLPNQNLLYRNQVKRTLLNQETAKPYLAKPESAKQEYGKSSFRNLLKNTLLNRNLIKQETGIC